MTNIESEEPRGQRTGEGGGTEAERKRGRERGREAERERWIERRGFKCRVVKQRRIDNWWSVE